MIRGLSTAAIALVVSATAWSAGFVASGTPDVGAAFWIALPFAFVVPVVYVPLVWWTTHHISGRISKITAAAIGGALLAVPIALGYALYSGGVAMSARFHVVCGLVFSSLLTAILSTRWGARLRF
jgi:hypothetical protein